MKGGGVDGIVRLRQSEHILINGTYIMSRITKLDFWNLTSAKPLGILGSVASPSAATTSQGYSDRNRKLWDTVSTYDIYT
jgi:hypothetical protein